MKYDAETGAVTLDPEAMDRARLFCEEDLEHLRDVILTAQEATGATALPGAEAVYHQIEGRVHSSVPDSVRNADPEAQLMLVRAYRALSREGWEEAESASEFHDALDAYLCNLGLDQEARAALLRQGEK